VNIIVKILLLPFVLLGIVLSAIGNAVAAVLWLVLVLGALALAFAAVSAVF
jgi:hypothetical protein